MDTFVVVDGVVASVWRGRLAVEVAAIQPDIASELLEHDPESPIGPVVAGMLWDGEALSLPPSPPPPPRVIPKATIAARLAEIGKAGAFRTAMAAQPAFELAWITPGSPTIEAEDADLLAALSAAGLTTEEVDTVTA